MRKDTRLSPLLSIASGEKLGRAWERGYITATTTPFVGHSGLPLIVALPSTRTTLSP